MMKNVENWKNTKKNVDNMRDYEEIYVENMKKYPLLYKLWDLQKFRDAPCPLYVGFVT